MATKEKTPCEEHNTIKSLKKFEKHLPNDVVETIILKLPIKSIMRFKAVSKAWNALTLDPRFARFHLRIHGACYNTNGDHNLFMLSPYDTNSRYRLAKFNGSKLEVLSHLRFPDDLSTSSKSCSIVASCDGFFLIYDYQRKTYVLWNPITGSNASFETYLGYPGSAHGIYYDSSNDDYKVVYITKKWYAVYSCRGRTWTESNEFTYKGVQSNPKGVTVRGVSYWVFSNTFDGGYYTREIVYFDAVECGFKTLHKPDEVRETDVFRLTSLNGRLCLYRSQHAGNESLQIWVLMHENNNDWIKLMDVQDLDPLRDCYNVKPLYLTEDHRIVIQDHGTQRSCFMVYDIRNQTSGGAWTLDDGTHSKVVTGLGSLVFPVLEN